MASPLKTRARIVLVPFPFDDLAGAKLRPAVCLCDPVEPHSHVIVAFITSRNVPGLLDSDLLLHPGQPDFSQTGLKVPSVLRLHRLITLSTSVFRRQLGLLSEVHQCEVRAKLTRLFGISK